jgi:LruC domain-containing protein
MRRWRMKTARYLFVAIGLVLLLSSCFMSNPWLSGGEGDSVYLPPDVINDTARSFSEPFEFETLLPVSLKLEIDFYELDSGGLGAKANEIPSAAGKAVVFITDSGGNVVYEGGVQADGTVNAQLALPAAPEDMVLTVKAQGYEDRSVKITDLVNYSEINRKMGLMSEGLSAKALSSPESWDRDGDLVPDIYDAFPDDPDYAFTLRYPSAEDEFLTVAFEDLYLQERAGDADYNDFLAQYKITEIYNGENKLSKITGEATAKVKIAGYNHEFGIAVRYDTDKSDQIEVTVKATYYDKYGKEHKDETVIPFEDIEIPGEKVYKDRIINKAVIPLFKSTKDAIGETATFEITFEGPIERDRVELAPFDPYLRVKETTYDIHLVGKDPLPDTKNPLESYDNYDDPETFNFMDGEGFPWALLVPVDWEHPPETVRIEKVYPFFTNWRLSKGASNTNWYLRKRDPLNEPPDAPTLTPDMLEFKATDLTLQEAKIDITLGTDPDGNDPVTLHWSVPPTYITVEENKEGPESHKVIVDLPEESSFDPPEELNIYFWCEDAKGARSDFAPLNLKFVEGSKLYGRIVIDTYSPNGSYTADTYIDLFDRNGDPDADDPWTGTDTGPGQALASADSGNPTWPMMARIDYTGGMQPGGTYYIRVRGATETVDDPYAIRVLSLNAGGALPEYIPLTPVLGPDSGENDDPVVFGPDTGEENAPTGWVPTNPVKISLGNANSLSRSIDNPSGLPGDGDIDWFILVLPE